jgi:hypothetical protein
LPLHDISQVRFEALASYARHPAAQVFATEVRWLADDPGAVLAVILLDTDGEYSAQLLARDLNERFRSVGGTGFFDKVGDAVDAAEHVAEEIVANLADRRIQGDEQGAVVDFFSPTRRRSKLNPAFLHLMESEAYSPARGIIEAMMRWYQDADGNFIEQFQTTGFDARIWELYLFASLNELGHVLDESFSVPDFVVRGPTEFAIEATTVNPTQHGEKRAVPPAPSDAPPNLEYHEEYLPIRYAGPLVAKLRKEYWRLPHVEGRPLVLAIQDFHAPMSMTWSRSALTDYLYGYRHRPVRHQDGSLEVVPERVEVHRWGTKEVPSGFFWFEGAENVSAILFNSSATLTKFNRIGQRAGFGSPDVLQVQQGYRVDHDPDASDPIFFVREVDEAFSESWAEGMDLFHNPQALYPLDDHQFPSAGHHRLEPGGTVTSQCPSWHPLSSGTKIVDMKESSERTGLQHQDTGTGPRDGD